LILCLIREAQRLKDIWGYGGVTPPFFTMPLDTGEWSPSRPRSFILGERELSIRSLGLGGPQSPFGRRKVEKNVLTLLGIEHRPSSP
jgi:hypothetical protein